MTKTGLILAAGLVVAAALPGRAQAPQKPPFAGFTGTSLDRKPGPQPFPGRTLPAPSAPAAAAPAASSGGLQLSGNWDAPTALSRGGPKQQRTELRALLTGYVNPGTGIAPHPGNRIYPPVTYLMPLNEALSRAGLAGRLQSGGPTSVVGFPSGLTFTSITAEGQRRYETRLLKDRADQVVAVEFTANDPRMLPPAPEILPPPTRALRGHTYDFVPEGITAVGREYPQNVWHRSDYVLIATRGGPRSADLYIPKPMVALILHCLDHAPAP